MLCGFDDFDCEERIWEDIGCSFLEVPHPPQGKNGYSSSGLSRAAHEALDSS